MDLIQNQFHLLLIQILLEQVLLMLLKLRQTMETISIVHLEMLVLIKMMMIVRLSFLKSKMIFTILL